MMSKIIVIAALVMGWGVFQNSSIDTFDEPESEIVLTNMESEKQPLESESNDYYEEYLKVLNEVGPKESESVSQSKPDVTSRSLDEKKSSKVKNENNLARAKDENSESDTDLGKQDESQKEKIEPIEVEKEVTLIATVDHKPFGELLKKYVNSKGNVNYAGMKNDQAKLEAYIKTLQANPVSSDQSKNTRLSYWINVYNAFTLKLILDNYPIKSITELENGKPWDKLFIRLGSTTYSLNDVENKIIRQRFTEPRIHFAVNCAAASCPPLLNDAYYPEKLINQLDERTRSFIANTSYNSFTSQKIEISKIFEWYAKDFGKINSFLSPYVSVNITDAKVIFKEYDWNLNKQ